MLVAFVGRCIASFSCSRRAHTTRRIRIRKINRVFCICFPSVLCILTTAIGNQPKPKHQSQHIEPKGGLLPQLIHFTSLACRRCGRRRRRRSHTGTIKHRCCPRRRSDVAYSQPPVRRTAGAAGEIRARALSSVEREPLGEKSSMAPPSQALAGRLCPSTPSGKGHRAREEASRVTGPSSVCRN